MAIKKIKIGSTEHELQTTISNVDGLQSALDGKAASSHSHSNASTTADGFMTTAMVAKLNGIAEGANNYTLPTASSTLGGVKTTSTVTSTSGLTACPIISGVPYYKNTTYSAATSSKNGLMSSTDKGNFDTLYASAYTNLTTDDANTLVGEVFG